MRLAVINLTAGGISGGYRKYLKHMVPGLAEHKDVDALMCIFPAGLDIAAWFNKRLSANYCTCRSYKLWHLARIPDIALAKCLKRFSPDIIFMPLERYVQFDNVPVVNMVRNMEPLVPRMKGDSPLDIFRKFIQRKLARNAIGRANHTIAVSGFVKDYLTGELCVADLKVSQVYHGIAQPPPTIRKRPPVIPFGWDGEFLFTCGSVRPARGLEDALEALSCLKAQNLDLRLVIAGQTTRGERKYGERLENLIVSAGLTDRVCWAGNLSDDEMSWCYDNCRLFIMTSRIEACPNIALEAMAHGAVSIAADNPPLPEFFSDCAFYYEAGNHRSLADAIINGMPLNVDERMAISQRSRKRSTIFSWDLTVEKTMVVLSRVLEQSKGHNDS